MVLGAEVVWLLSELDVDAGPLVVEAEVWATVESAEVVSAGAAEVVEEVEEVDEVEEVVGSAEVVGSSEVVGASEVVDDVDDDVVEVVSGASELEDEVVSLVISETMLERPALCAATAVNSSAWTKNERLEIRIFGTNVWSVTREDQEGKGIKRISRK